MKIVYNTWFPFGGYSTFNFFGILFTKQKELTPKSINHERIHTKQMVELAYIGFYIWYGLEYLAIRLLRLGEGGQHGAYKDVSFEEEAYNNEDNLDYIKTRKHYSWWKFVKMWSNK